ncbi:hypothetical protein [Amycolatopsis nigrescens]|uniref:hypothetical protein n=1 Tax=Amycolatopsis nigrescens TaxID=381445 RepID=UPI00037F9668|nr:hypothetical protein [Amycolatopsis nigrescens]
MKGRVLFALLAGALLVTGVVCLALPVAVDLSRSTVTCGTGFSTDTERLELFTRAGELNRELGVSSAPPAAVEFACEDALMIRRLWAWPLLGLGAIGLLSALARFRGRRPTG